MSLFKLLKAPDRKETQLAYRVKYWPYKELSSAGRALLARQRLVFLSKATIMSRVNADMTKLADASGNWHDIVWAYNNMPTEAEWNKWHNTSYLACEYRRSAAIDSYAVAILSFDLPSARCIPHSQGEFA